LALVEQHQPTLLEQTALILFFQPLPLLVVAVVARTQAMVLLADRAVVVVAWHQLQAEPGLQTKALLVVAV
jgi:hypothetical protein